MMTKKRFGVFGCAAAAALMLVAGCKGVTPPVQFYTLTAQAAAVEVAAGAAAQDSIAVGVGPLELPKMLDRPQIVTRDTDHRLRLAEFHRWGGSLPEDILRVLTENLAGMLRSNRVMAYPWADYFQPDYRVYMVFHRFDGRPGQNVVLEATWTLTDPRGRQALSVRKSVIRELPSSPDYDSLVSAQSRALGVLARHIAEEIARLRAR